MKKAIFALSLIAIATSAMATDGNNGSGAGGCGVGQQTNGCGGGDVVYIPGPIGPQGIPGVDGKDGKDGANGTNGTNGVDGKDGIGIAGADGKDGKDGIGKDGANGKDGLDGKDATVPNAATTSQLAAANKSLREEIRQQGRNAYAGTASATAIASIPQAPEPGTKIIGAGAGYFRGESALALGMSYRSESGKWISKASVGVDSRGSGAVGVGAAFVWK